MSVFEAAVFAAEFAEAVGDKRCNGHRKFFMSLLEFVLVCLFTQTNKNLNTPLDGHGSPCQSGTKSGQHQLITFFQHPFTVDLIQKNCHTGSGCISTFIHIHRNLLIRHFQTFCNRCRDSRIRLMEQIPVNVLCGQICCFQCLQNGLRRFFTANLNTSPPSIYR